MASIVPPSCARASATPRRVLIVDGDVDSAELFGLLLERGGYEIRVTHDPAEAILSAHLFLPDVAILDISLPGINGYELVKLLRTTPGAKSCRFIATTTSAAEGLAERSSEAGFETHLTKPVVAEELLHAVAGATAAVAAPPSG